MSRVVNLGALPNINIDKEEKVARALARAKPTKQQMSARRLVRVLAASWLAPQAAQQIIFENDKALLRMGGAPALSFDPSSGVVTAHLPVRLLAQLPSPHVRRRAAQTAY